MDVTLKRVESAAPDQASLKAARKLLDRRKWPLLHCSADGTWIWGECQGSGAQPYRMAVDTRDLGAKCSCPSRKFPCKHALALMWWRADEAEAFVESAVPDWINEWAGRRRPVAEREDKPRVSIAEARDAAPAADPAAEERKKARSEAQRKRNREAREQSILAGLDELDTWIEDQLERGLGAFSQAMTEQCRVVSQRLADAKATSLASRIDMLPGRVLSVPDAERNAAMIEALGELRLLAQAYRRQDQLGEALRHDVRALIGWNTQRAELLENDQAKRVRGEWMVMGTLSETQADRLMRMETWLSNLEDGTGAVLTDYVPVSAARGVTSPFVAGQVIDAELVFFPSATPQGAVIAEQADRTAGGAPEMPVEQDLGAALERFDEALAANPWVNRRLLACRDSTLAVAADGRPWLRSTTDTCAVPISGSADVSPLGGLPDLVTFGLFDGRTLMPLAAHTPIGWWWANDA